MDERRYVPAAGSDRLLRFYDPLTRLLGVGKVHRRLVELAAIGPGQRVLEIGCGTGRLSMLVKRLQADAEVTGLDPDPRALERARRNAHRGHVDVRFEQGFAESLPFADATFDHVLSSLMLHHLPPRAKRGALAEARRVLRPGGALHLVDFSGAGAGPHALLARVLGHRHGSQPDATVLAVMREAGFLEPATLGGELRVVGELTYYGGTAPA